MRPENRIGIGKALNLTDIRKVCGIGMKSTGIYIVTTCCDIPTYIPNLDLKVVLSEVLTISQSLNTHCCFKIILKEV